MSKNDHSAYRDAGVDIDEMMTGLAGIKRMVKRTAVPGVLSDIGSFGGLFQSPGKGSVLVASTDGVGTKLKVAAMAGRHHTVGRDLVNHCVNDILVQGAKPLFFMDYVGTARLDASIFHDVVAGLCSACRENGCALLSGETAEMPGLYPHGEYDLVGTIVGAVARNRLITGKDIKPGDVLIGLPSNGLHTNGYSLARRIFFDRAGLHVDDPTPFAKRTVADALLAVHRSYLKPVSRLIGSTRVRGMAHITGGGLTDNVPRVLPDGLQAVIDRNAWRVPPMFRWMAETGQVDEDEMYRVFNMGIGYVVIVRHRDAATALETLQASRSKPKVIGFIRRGRPAVTYTS